LEKVVDVFTLLTTVEYTEANNYRGMINIVTNADSLDYKK